MISQFSYFLFLSASIFAAPCRTFRNVERTVEEYQSFSEQVEQLLILKRSCVSGTF